MIVVSQHLLVTFNNVCIFFSNIRHIWQGQHWVLDPIDGTRGFVGMRQYAVCLGLLEGGQVITWAEPTAL